MTKPYEVLDNGLIAVPRDDLQYLVDDLKNGWDDHSYAMTEDNPGWVRAREILIEANNALKKRWR